VELQLQLAAAWIVLVVASKPAARGAFQVQRGVAKHLKVLVASEKKKTNAFFGWWHVCSKLLRFLAAAPRTAKVAAAFVHDVGDADGGARCNDKDAHGPDNFVVQQACQ
jgi:hypothetical protein